MKAGTSAYGRARWCLTLRRLRRARRRRRRRGRPPRGRAGSPNRYRLDALRHAPGRSAFSNDRLEDGEHVGVRDVGHELGADPRKTYLAIVEGHCCRCFAFESLFF